MSNNPFFDLADYLETLNEGSGTVFDRFVDFAEEGEDWTEAHKRVFGTYLQCESLLKAQGKEASARIVLAPIWDFLVNPDLQWQSYSPDALQPLQIESLRLLGNDQDVARVLPASLTPEELDALRVAFEKIHEIVQSHESIPQELAAHIIYLCNRGTDLLKGERVDLVALRTICFETITLSQAASVTLPEETQGTFWNAVRSLWNRWGYPTAVNVASTVIGGVVLDEITQG